MPRTPKYRKHSVRDIAYVAVDGKRIYLPGKFDSAESHAAYHKVLAGRSIATTTGPRTFITVSTVTRDYLIFASSYYPTGRNSEFALLERAVKTLGPYHNDVATDFGPRKLRKIMESLAAHGNSRGYINRTASRIRRIFKWAAGEELVPVSVYQALATVTGLRRGAAREAPKKTGAPWAHVLPVFYFLTPPIKAMLWLQLYTGARSGSVCQARAEQFDLAADPWHWRPRHKTEFRGTEIVLPIGPRCQKRIAAFLCEPGFMFHPPTGNKRYRDHYDSTSYAWALRRAQVRAGVPLWTPHQLRHARGESVRKRHGLEAAQAILAHATLDATQIYTARQLALANQVARLDG